METLSGTIDPDDRTYISMMKFFQVINQLGIFIIPSVIFALLVTNNVAGYLSLDRFPRAVSALLTILLIYTMLPAIHALVQVNEHLQLPGNLEGLEEWMKESESAAARLTEAFLNTGSPMGLLFNLFMVGVLAAVGEELLFRSVLIRLFRGWFGNVHMAVIVSSLLFSAFHLQFYGFLPRFMLGLVFGYLFVWSGSVWLPILAHFVNNASAVIVYFLANKGVLKEDVKDFGATDNYLLLIIATLISFLIGGYIYFSERRKRLSPQA
ncbi:MAG: CPBP family intramembrane glutamic endopeptidase [Bacteroidales bacterium]